MVVIICKNAWQGQHDLVALSCLPYRHWIYVSYRETFSKRSFTEENVF
jgi:hypothetical protein